MTHPYWPLFDISVSTERLELRLPSDDEIGKLMNVAADGVHDPSFMPFTVAWTDQPSPDRERKSAQWHWIRRAQWDPLNWSFGLATFLDGEPIGAQDVMAKNFPVLKTVSSGSWLGRRYQGRGLGKEMRAAMLHFAFEGLGAELAESAARVENASSIGVSKSLGYEENGLDRRPDARGEGAIDVVRFRLTRERWQRAGRIDVRIQGLTKECLEMFGAS